MNILTQYIFSMNFIAGLLIVVKGLKENTASVRVSVQILKK